MKKLFILLFLFTFSLILLPIASAEKNIEEVVQDLDIKIDGTSILRAGNEIIIRPVIINTNVNESIAIKKNHFQRR